MDLHDRPKFAHFSSRIGGDFRATTAEGSPAGVWKLVSAEPLPKPPLESLADADCFTLLLSCDPGNSQGCYDLTDNDGVTVRLFAVPTAPDEMCVTVN